MAHRVRRVSKKKECSAVSILPLRRRTQPSSTKSVKYVTAGVASLSVSNTTALSETKVIDCGRFDPLQWYVRCLSYERQWFPLSRGNTFAFKDCDERGSLDGRKKYQLVTAKTFASPSGECCVLFLCSCDNGLGQSCRLSATSKSVANGRVQSFSNKEEALYCIHSKAARQLVLDLVTTEDVDEGEEVVVDQLQADPYLAAVHDGETYGILKRQGQRAQLACLTCTDRQKSCTHLSAYKEWCTDHGVNSEIVQTATREQTFDSVSKSTIPYPWSDDMMKIYEQYEDQRRKFPRTLVPDTPTEPCRHGHSWDSRNPVEQGWVVHTGVTIYTRGGTLTAYYSDDGQSHPRVSYYRPTEGMCSCRHYYDGLGDLLHNVDNRNMMYMGFLLDYMHCMVDGREPLKATQRSVNRTRSAASNFKELPYELLRRGWNSFGRRLMQGMDLSSVYYCPICETDPGTLIFDGTNLGFRRDLIPECTPEPSSDMSSSADMVQGSKHSDRVFLTSEKARRLLLQYSGSRRGTKGKSKGVSQEEMSTLLGLLEGEGREDLASVISRLRQEDGGHLAPAGYSAFFAELARNTPVCGMFQMAGDEMAIKFAKEVAKGNILLKQERDGKYLSYLQQKAPILCTFVLSIATDEEGHIPADVSTLLRNLIKILVSTYDKVPEPSPSCYPPPPASSPLSFFPSLPKRCGLPCYAMDKRRDAVKARDGCRKESYGHPTLTPGIFTIFCKHGICYGFEAMTSCESPYHPFEIIRSRFKVAPQIIVYDNACKLHRYVMNREPHFFRNTTFLVDRFHFKGHIGCSLGYCMDTYKTFPDIKSINSQVNEQANSGLIRIQPQVSYMTPSNFMFHISLFLAIRNMDAISSLPKKNPQQTNN